jgi:colicin import membrane protein
MAEKLSPRLQKMKAKNPKRFAEYMALKKRTGRTSRDAARKTVDKTIKGTPAEKAAIAKGKKAAIKARKEGKSEKAAKALGKKIALDQMKTDRSKTNVEAAWTAATILPLGLGQTARGIRTAYKSGQAVKQLVSDRVKKEAAKKAAAAAKKKAAAAAKKAKDVKGFLPQSQKAKKINRAAATAEAKKKAADTARRKATSTVTKGEKGVKAANVKGRGKMLNFVERGAMDPVKGIRIATPLAATIGRIDSPNKKKAADNKEKIMVNKKSKPKVVSAPLPKPKPKRKSKIKDFTDVNEIDYDTDKDEGNGTEERKSLGEAMFGGFKTGDFTPKDQTVKNPFTGKDMELKYEYPDDPDDGMKKGGSIKKNMKKKKAKTKVKKRVALRGYGAALRGF